jgi:hypothetical protein
MIKRLPSDVWEHLGGWLKPQDRLALYTCLRDVYARLKQQPHACFTWPGLDPVAKMALEIPGTSWPTTLALLAQRCQVCRKHSPPGTFVPRWGLLLHSSCEHSRVIRRNSAIKTYGFSVLELHAVPHDEFGRMWLHSDTPGLRVAALDTFGPPSLAVRRRQTNQANHEYRCSKLRHTLKMSNWRTRAAAARLRAHKERQQRRRSKTLRLSRLQTMLRPDTPALNAALSAQLCGAKVMPVSWAQVPALAASLGAFEARWVALFPHVDTAVNVARGTLPQVLQPAPRLDRLIHHLSQQLVTFRKRRRANAFPQRSTYLRWLTRAADFI